MCVWRTYYEINGHKALKPNIEYTTYEWYKYITDEKGRNSIVEGTLHRQRKTEFICPKESRGAIG